MAGSIAEVYMESFDTNMLFMLKEFKGGLLKQGCQVKTEKGRENIHFTRMTESNTFKGKLDMLSAEFQSNAGDAKKFTVSPEYVYWADVKDISALNKTDFDLESNYLTSAVNAIEREEDNEVIAAIKAKDSSLRKAGNVSVDLVENTLENIEALLASLKYSITVAHKIGVEKKKKVYLLINIDDYSLLYSKKEFISSDFKDTSGNFFEVIPIPYPKTMMPSGTAYIMPSGTCGWGEWENTAETHSEYFFQRDQLHMMAKKSMSAVCVEPDVITKFSYKQKV